MIGGRVSKAAHNVVLTTNAIKRHLGLPLSPEEQRIEDAFKQGEYAPEQRPPPQVVGLRRARLQADDRTPPRRSGGTL
jgi:hypothetical protein